VTKDKAPPQPSPVGEGVGGTGGRLQISGFKIQVKDKSYE